MRLLGCLNRMLKFWNVYIKKCRITSTAHSTEYTFIIYKYKQNLKETIR